MAVWPLWHGLLWMRPQLRLSEYNRLTGYNAERELHRCGAEFDSHDLAPLLRVFCTAIFQLHALTHPLNLLQPS